MSLHEITNLLFPISFVGYIFQIFSCEIKFPIGQETRANRNNWIFEKFIYISDVYKGKIVQKRIVKMAEHASGLIRHRFVTALKVSMEIHVHKVM